MSCGSKEGIRGQYLKVIAELKRPIKISYVCARKLQNPVKYK